MYLYKSRKLLLSRSDSEKSSLYFPWVTIDQWLPNSPFCGTVFLWGAPWNAVEMQQKLVWNRKKFGILKMVIVVKLTSIWRNRHSLVPKDWNINLSKITLYKSAMYFYAECCFKNAILVWSTKIENFFGLCCVPIWKNVFREELLLLRYYSSLLNSSSFSFLDPFILGDPQRALRELYSSSVRL